MMGESKNPRCPYCGTVMTFDGHMAIQSPMGKPEYAGFRGHYLCPECLSTSPEVFEKNKLVAMGVASSAAQKRYKGEKTT